MSNVIDLNENDRSPSESSFMSEMFSKYANWKILLHFIKNPTGEFYVNEVSGSLEVGRGTASQSLRLLASMGLLRRIERGNLCHYRLNDCILTRELKRMYVISVLSRLGVAERLVGESPSILTVALYGSYSSGGWDEKSDIDLLVVTAGGQNVDYMQSIEEASNVLGAEINVEAVPSSVWLNLRESRDAFYESIIRNHIVLYGGELP